MTKFTKGKWTVSRSREDSLGSVVVVDNDGEIIHYVCEVEEAGKSSDEIKADARLIASAPEMFDKLVDYAELLDYLASTNYHECWDIANRLLRDVKALLARIKNDTGYSIIQRCEAVSCLNS